MSGRLAGKRIVIMSPLRRTLPTSTANTQRGKLQRSIALCQIISKQYVK
jgi:hypothetical protein